MKHVFKTIIVAMAFISITASIATAQNNQTRTSSKILYHNGAVRTNIQDVYFIFYGCWQTAACTSPTNDLAQMMILTDFMSTVGNTPYMFINSTYTDSSGQTASPALVYGGYVVDNTYRHGNDLTKSDIEAILNDHIGDPSGQTNLPADPQGIYIIVASADIASAEAGFCTPGAPPFHDYYLLYGSARTPYIFLGNPSRCPSVAGANYYSPGGVTPNGNYAGDVLVNNLAHAMNGVLTNPYDNGWYDRYGLENADKCMGSYGTTYTTPNGAWANIRLGQRDFLLEQNWINDRKGRCAMHL